MKSLIATSLSFATLCLVSISALAQTPPPTCGCGHIQDDIRPLVWIAGNSDPGHVVISNPDDDNPTIYVYTVSAQGRGHSSIHPHPVNKIARLRLRSCKGEVPKPLYTYREGAATNANEWTLKWSYECSEFHEESELPLAIARRCNIAYQAAGIFWWVGGAMDSWNYQDYSFNAWWFYTEPHGSYYTNNP